MNKVGAPLAVFPTLVNFRGSHAFQNQGTSMVWDEKKHTFEKPNANERERILGFCTHTIVAFNFNEIQW
jgi:hypothetical protein